MLGTAQADALSTELARLSGVVGSIGIGAYLQLAVLVAPRHNAAKLTGDGSFNRRDDAVVNVTGGTVDGDPVALAVGLARQLELLVLLVHLDGRAAGYAALAHAARNNGGVTGHTAANGQYALSSLHALDVLGRGLQTNQ